MLVPLTALGQIEFIGRQSLSNAIDLSASVNLASSVPTETGG
jgi:hypothetical protein